MKAILAGLILVVSFSVNAGHSWGDYHWAAEVKPFNLKVIDSVTGEWDNELRASIAAWSTTSVLSMSVDSQNDSSKLRKRCNFKSGQLRVCNARYGANGWLGLASIRLDDNGHIVSGYAKMNDTYSSYWAVQAEKNHVMCQEIGHVLGLGHTSEDGSSQQTCMDYSDDTASQWPNAHDREQLEAIYAHPDSYNTVDTGDTVPDSGSCNSPAGKGCNKSEPFGLLISKRGHSEMWVKTNDIGGYDVTHVHLVKGHDH